MQKRKLGKSTREVSAIGLGCMRMSFAYGSPEERDEQESIATIHRAIELGVTFLDTAEAYGPYTNEELLARALQGKRDRVVIATKFGFKFDEKGGLAGTDSRPEHIRDVVVASLRRLQTDPLDLLYRPRAVRAARPWLPHRIGQACRGLSGGRLPARRSTLSGRELRGQHAGRLRRA